jgi:hypothetical protein
VRPAVDSHPEALASFAEELRSLPCRKTIMRSVLEKLIWTAASEPKAKFVTRHMSQTTATSPLRRNDDQPVARPATVAVLWGNREPIDNHLTEEI